MDMRASCHYSRFFLSGTASSPYVLAQVVDSRINWGNAFWFNFIPVTIGSIVGAWFLVIPFWFVNKDGFWKRQEREAAAKAAKEEKVVEA